MNQTDLLAHVSVQRGTMFLLPVVGNHLPMPFTGGSIQSSVEENGGFFRDYQWETRIREKVDYSQRKVALAGDFATFFFECLNFFIDSGNFHSE